VLDRVQSGFGYRVTTGGLLAAFMALQWSLPVCRMQGYSRLAKRLYSWHNTAGAFGPVLLMLHSARMGFGFIALLCAAFISNTLLGAFGPARVQRFRTYASQWFISHVALSLLLVGLAGYHAWTALYFE